MRRVGAENEGGLEEPLVHDPAASAVPGRVRLLRALGVLVAETEAQELRRIETHVGPDSPLIAWIGRILRRVVAHAECPPPPRLDLAPAVPAEAVAGLLLERVEDAVAVEVHTALGATDGIDALAGEREQWMQPAVRPILELEVVADQRAPQPLGRLAIGHGSADLQRHRVGQ